MQIAKDCPDKLFKVRPIINAIKERFETISPTKRKCIHEQMLLYKGRSKLREYNPQKPKRGGYRLYALTS